MSANFTGVTFAKQRVTPSYDGIIRRALLTDGTLTGCDMSYSGSTLTMAAGQLMICGRQIVHPSNQNWAVTERTSGYARLVITVDLTRTSTKETFDQVVDSIQYATSVNGFAPLEQTDINTTGTKYQVVACVVSLGTGGITGIVSKLEKCEGGGAGLNFKVVGGTTTPGSPTENTIWVKTAIDIPYWTTASSAKAPAYVAKEGTVTFWWESATSTEVSSTTSTGFMPIKSKATNPPGYMRLKPINCYQNQDGTAAGWKPMEAFTYKSGQWVDWWDGSSLYKDGNEYPTATGGWAARGWELRDVYTAQVPTLNKQADKMVATQTGKGTYVSGVVEILNDIDLTPYTTLSIEYMGTGVNETHYFTLGVASRGAAYYNTNALAQAQPTYKAGESAKATANLDISEVNQAADVFLGLHLTPSMNGTATLNIYRVWLE